MHGTYVRLSGVKKRFQTALDLRIRTAISKKQSTKLPSPTAQLPFPTSVYHLLKHTHNSSQLTPYLPFHTALPSHGQYTRTPEHIGQEPQNHLPGLYFQVKHWASAYNWVGLVCTISRVRHSIVKCKGK